MRHLLIALNLAALLTIPAASTVAQSLPTVPVPPEVDQILR